MSGLTSDTKTVGLWRQFQKVIKVLGHDRSKIGFLDVAVYGAQSSGKSSLLSALCGLGLPSGGGVVTRCPVRLTVVDDTDKSFLMWPGPGGGQQELPYEGNKPFLPTDLYTEALQKLSGGRMTNQELEIKVGRPGDLPLNIVDTPGLITNDVPDKPVVDKLVREVLAGSGNPEQALLPIMACKCTDVDLNNTSASLVTGRGYITVFTHIDYLSDDPVGFTIPTMHAQLM